MTASNPIWNPGDRPPLRITAAGIRALAYFDYVNARHFISADLTHSDRAVPEQYDDERQPPDAPPDPRTDYWPGGAYWNMPDLEDMDDDSSDYGPHSPEED